MALGQIGVFGNKIIRQIFGLVEWGVAFSKLEKAGKMDGMLVEKIFGDSGVWGMKWYAVGESSWGK